MNEFFCINKIWVDLSGNGWNSSAVGGTPTIELEQFNNDKHYKVISGSTSDSIDWDHGIMASGYKIAETYFKI